MLRYYLRLLYFLAFVAFIVRNIVVKYYRIEEKKISN